MNNPTPNPIKEYYIAYFDILGYKAFFEESPEKAPEFLNIINSAIKNTLTTIKFANDSKSVSQLANIHIQSKIFSDNVLLCIEVGDDITKEQSRIIAFMGIISAIQRGFITECGLFLRGGFTKGTMSINDDYVFGEGLIKAVQLEEKTVYPRIAISDEIINYFTNSLPYSQEEYEQALSIWNRNVKGENISDEDEQFFLKIQKLSRQITFDTNSRSMYRLICTIMP